MQHQQHGTFHHRSQISAHLRSEHLWEEVTWQTTVDGTYVQTVSELLATHRELHELDMLDELVRGAR